MLDVSALPNPPGFLHAGHVFVLELQNISPAACSLQPPQVALLPASDANNQPFYTFWTQEDPGHAIESRPQVLEPGAWAHLLFVWRSRAAPELSCDLYSGVRLGFSYQWQERDEPDIAIRHLWIRACGPLAVTGYRPGRYSSASPIPQSWLDWYGPGGLKDMTFQLPATSTEMATASPLLSLSAPAKRMMLGDRLLSLRLDFPRFAAEGCAFTQMRKRESDGSTIIAIQQCDDTAPDKNAGPPAVPWHHEPGVVGLWMGTLDFDPKHTGPLRYDIIAPIGRINGQKKAPQYARTQVDLVVRDPALPKQVAILDPLPACTRTQLRVVSLAPVISTPLKMLRAYNASNITPQACSLAGVPRTRGLDDMGDYQPFLPPACPNCENEFFKPRPNGRIDLNQGDTAHLLVASSGRGSIYCTSTSKLEFSFNRDANLNEPHNIRPLPEDIAQSAVVPFGGHDCVSIDISAWRQGPYDGDPLNLHQAGLAWANAAPKLPIPTDCNKPDLLIHGRPYPIEGTHDPEYGISMEQHEFVRDEAISLYLWTDNSTTASIQLGSCNGHIPSYLKGGGLVLYDAYGHRILNPRQIASDAQCKRDPSGYYELPVCTLNVSVALPAHTCTNGRFDLADYDLPPGEYTISTHDPRDTGSCPRRGEKPYKPDPASDIHFTVIQP
jgi:hypothetical protein